MAKTKRVTIHKSGKKPISFKGGALHQQLGVPRGQKIPPGKKAAALRGDYGPMAKKRASFAFKGALAAGRQTAKKK
jgi:hypothetical protein